MKLSAAYSRLSDFLAGAARAVEAPFALALRIWVGLVFLKSGWLKLTTFENTLFLFREEYRVPLLPPDLAAVMGTGGELAFGALVILGLGGRIAPLGLSAVNALAVVSYAHVLLSEGFEAALGQHWLWGLMLAVLTIHGPGRWSLDALLAPGIPATQRVKLSAR